MKKTIREGGLFLRLTHGLIIDSIDHDTNLTESGTSAAHVSCHRSFGNFFDPEEHLRVPEDSSYIFFDSLS